MSLTIFIGALLPLIFLVLLYGWFRRRTDSPDYWRTTSIAALVLAVVRTTLVYGGFYTAANPFMPTALRIAALISGMLVLPETILFISKASAHSPRGEQHLILATATFTGAVLWTFALAGLARWIAKKPVEVEGEAEPPPPNVQGDADPPPNA